MDFHDDVYYFSIDSWQTFHAIYSHIGVPYNKYSNIDNSKYFYHW